MECPYCKNEMIAGYVQSFDHIYFNRGKKARFLASGDLKSKSLTRFSLRAPNVKAYLCENCEKIIIDINRRQHEQGIYKL